jgi:hypothetical protein
MGADGLVLDSNPIRWVGAPAEITRWGQHDEKYAACHRHEAMPTIMV